jgi:hypothetical protein
MSVDGEFQFLIGDTSRRLTAATIWYKSIADEKWTTEIVLLGGHPVTTNVVAFRTFSREQLRRKMTSAGGGQTSGQTSGKPSSSR